MLKFAFVMKTKIGYKIEEIAQIVAAVKRVMPDPSAEIETLAYDSRKLHDVRRALFFALRGMRDGHDFIGAAYAKGIRNFVISDRGGLNELTYPDANFMVVADTLRALQQLAGHHRRKFTYPVLAITGSNGKTMVKDWLYQLVSPEKRIVRSPKSFNSQLGVALSLWEMSANYDLAIIEAGISRRGEMASLVEMIQPDIAVLTNVGSAHQEGFRDLSEKTQEKLRLLEGASIHVYSCDTVQPTTGPDVKQGTHWTWGEQSNNRFRVLGSARFYREGRSGTEIRAQLRGESDPRVIWIPFTDAASIENALTCWTVMLMLGYDQETIARRMSRLQVMEMRLELKQGIANCTVIDDSYSNDLSSLRIALDVLRQQRQHPMKTLILSDLPDVGGDEAWVYAKIAELLRTDPPDRLVSVGPEFAARKGTFPVAEHLVFETTEALLEALPQLNLRDQTILLKGARRYGFERISKRMVAQSHQTTMEIYMQALEHNFLQYKSLLDEGVRTMVMVKAFSYGSGSFEIAGMLQFLGVDYLAVAYADEGVALRKAGVSLPILVMSPDRASFPAIYAYRLEPELYSFAVLEDWQNWLKLQRHADESPYPVHIKLDTGMHRLGFAEHEMSRLGRELADQQLLGVQSVFSHLAASGDPTMDAFTDAQLDAFTRMADELAHALSEPFIRHIANTDAISRFPNAQLDLVRLGIGFYGLDSGSRPNLQMGVGLKTTITQIRHLPPGETVGYNRHGRITRQSRIATVQIGYADGYDRRFGNGVGTMSIGGHTAPTIGDICMDMCMLDITDLPDDIREGDEVVVYGSQSDLTRAAAAIGTIPYELLVSISQRVKRIYYY